jgi:hypothetical protein
MKEIRVFLASSNELKEERQLFEMNMYRKCQQWFKQKQIFLYLDIWENMSDKMSKTHSQDEYNKFVANADIVVVLGYTKIGEYTLSEFETAKRTFNKTNKPFIFVYFKKEPLATRDNIKDLNKLYSFQDMLDQAGYFFPTFNDFNHLWGKFNNELDNLVGNDFEEVKNLESRLKKLEHAKKMETAKAKAKKYEGL